MFVPQPVGYQGYWNVWLCFMVALHCSIWLKTFFMKGPQSNSGDKQSPCYCVVTGIVSHIYLVRSWKITSDCTSGDAVDIG